MKLRMLTFSQQDEDSMGPEALNGAFQLLHTGKMFPKLSKRRKKNKENNKQEKKHFRLLNVSRQRLN
jgi:hypothetical protein